MNVYKECTSDHKGTLYSLAIRRALWSGQLDLIIVLVCLVKSIPVDCNHYC